MGTLTSFPISTKLLSDYPVISTLTTGEGLVVQGSTPHRYNIAPDNCVFVQTAADIATLQSNTCYKIRANITVTTGWDVTGLDNISIDPDSSISSITFDDATGTLFSGTNVGRIVVGVGLIAANSTETLQSITSANNTIDSMFYTANIDKFKLGTATTTNIHFTDTHLHDIEEGLVLNSCQLHAINIETGTTNPVTGLTYFTVKGADSNIRVLESKLIAQSSEDIFDIQPTMTGTVDILNSSAPTAGGKYYKVRSTGAITAFADGGGGTTLCTTPDASPLQTFGEISVTGQNKYTGEHVATYVSATTFTIPVAYNADTGQTGAWSNGSLTDINKKVNALNNRGERDSKTVGEAYLTATYTTPTLAANTTHILGGMWNCPILERLDHQSAIGTETRGYFTVQETTEELQLYKIEVRGHVNKNSGPAEAVKVYPAVNGVASAEYIAQGDSLSSVDTGTGADFQFTTHIEANSTNDIEIGTELTGGGELNFTFCKKIVTRIA